MNTTLYIAATPIGNLSDTTQRLLDVLRNADLILCEDTRVTKKLLNYFKITTHCVAFHQHTTPRQRQKLIEKISEVETAVLVSDAGTPAISDPGNMLVREIVEKQASISISTLPGPSAAIAALSVSGLRADQYTFLGFIPHVKKRCKFIEGLFESKHTTVCFESCHRIKKALKQFKEVGDPSRKIVICRELTKLHEEIIHTTVGELDPEAVKPKGEFVVVIEGN